MNCKEFNDKLSLFIDDELNNEEKKQIEEHIKDCNNCRKQYVILKKIVDELNAVPQEQLPEGYCKNLHNKLKQVHKKSKIKFNWRRYTIVAATVVLVFVAGFIYMGANQNILDESMNRAGSELKYDLAPAPPPASEPEATYENDKSSDDGISEGSYELSYVLEEDNKSQNYSKTSLQNTDKRTESYKELKIIKDGYVYIETEDYNTFTENLIVVIRTFNGYVQNQENYTNSYKSHNGKELKNGSMIIRVPQDKFYDTMEYISNNGAIRNESTNETDVTKSYYEKDNKVKNLKVQEERLLELVNDAENVTEILQIENELSRTRTEIDNLNIDLSNIDDRVYMSTINIEIKEVETLNQNISSVDKTLWQKSKEGFIKTINGIINFIEYLIILMVSVLPVLIIVGIITLIAILIVKNRKKK